MKRTAILIALTLLVAPCFVTVQDAEAAGTADIPTALVVDSCRAYTDPDQPEYSRASLVSVIHLNGSNIVEFDWIPSLDLHSSAVFATLAGYDRTHVFVSHGSKVSVYDLGDNYYEEPDYLFRWIHVYTIDVGALLGVSGFQVSKMATGRWTGVQATPGQFFNQAALYLIGTRPGENEAYYAVLDQQWLIEQTLPNGGTHLYGGAQICSSPVDCTVSEALDIRVGDLGDASQGYTEEAYINVFHEYGPYDYQITYRLERGLFATEFTLTPLLGSMLDVIDVEDFSGIRFVPNSHDVYVPLKTERVVRNLTGGVNSCPLDQEPIDVAVWEPGVGPVSRYVLAATGSPTDGVLQIFDADDFIPSEDPAEDCPNNTPVESIAIGAEPASIDIFPVDDDELWALVVTRASKQFEAIHLQLDLVNGGFESDPVVYDMVLDPATEDSCPSFVHFGLHDWQPPPPELDSDPGLLRKCLDGDPRCPPSL